MPIQGFVRDRAHQFGRQPDVGAHVSAARRYAFKGVPSVNLNWTDPDVDVGSIDPVADPYRVAPTLSASLNSPAVEYNTLPLIFSAFFGGQVIGLGGGTAKTWSWAPTSDASDALDPVTYEFGDDVLTDWYQLGDGLLNSFELNGPEGLGPFTASLNWRFGAVASTGSTDSPVEGSVPTALTLPLNQPYLYLKDFGIYIASTVAGLPAGQILDALHSIVIRGTQAWDEKRFANQAQVFDVNDYGRGDRAIEVVCTFAKTADTVGVGSESDAWMSDEVVNRYMELKAVSTVMAEGAIPYSMDLKLPCRYYTREETDINGNTAIILTAHAFLEATTFGGVFTADVVNTLTGADLDGVQVS